MRAMGWVSGKNPEDLPRVQTYSDRGTHFRIILKPLEILEFQFHFTLLLAGFGKYIYICIHTWYTYIILITRKAPLNPFPECPKACKMSSKQLQFPSDTYNLCKPH